MLLLMAGIAAKLADPTDAAGGRAAGGACGYR
jgi:hypothetical protein